MCVTRLTPYVRPQESGSHTGVRWAEVMSDAGLGLRLDSVGGMEPVRAAVDAIRGRECPAPE
nr:hypothetical protein [Demequina litorisediminis]